MMNILVTGGAGFIGSNIVDRLVEKNYNVTIIDNLSTGKKENLNNKASFYKMAIQSNQIKEVFKKEKIDYIIHTAAQIDVQKSIKDPLADCKSNIIGTLNLLKYSIKYNIKKFIYSSSAAVYGKPKYLPIDEKHPVKALSAYGISKLTPERYIEIYNQLHGLKYAILRYSNAYGPRQDPLGEGGVISIFIDNLLNNKEPIIYGDGTQTRDFIYVGDIVKANLISLNCDSNDVFNISCNKKHSINQLYKLINKILDKDLKPIYKETKKGDIKNSVLDNSKAKKILNWEPEYDLKTGLIKTINYYN